jgi:hypothetical protein
MLLNLDQTGCVSKEETACDRLEEIAQNGSFPAVDAVAVCHHAHKGLICKVPFLENDLIEARGLSNTPSIHRQRVSISSSVNVAERTR